MRDGGISGRSLWALVSLALFYFVFPSYEFFFDGMVGRVFGASSAVIAQSLALGSNALGFLLFALFSRLLPARARRPVTVMGMLAVSLCLVAAASLPAGAPMLFPGCLAFLILGVAGGASHWVCAHALAGSAYLGRAVGCAYGAGIVLLFVNNALLFRPIAEAGALSVATICLVAACGLAWPTGLSFGPDGRGNVPDGALPAVGGKAVRTVGWCRGPGARMLVTVILMACMFVTLDNLITAEDIRGSLDMEALPRLLLALSGVAAGFLYDVAHRRYMGVTMFCMTLVSVMSIIVIEVGHSPLLALLIFYVTSAFFVVFFTVGFLRIAPGTRFAELWAGMGRIANNICALLIVFPSLALIQSGDIALVIGLALALFAAIALAMHAAGMVVLSRDIVVGNVSGRDRGSDRVPDDAGRLPRSLEERLAAFSAEYGLTPREAQVMSAVIADERPLKHVAVDLGISLRMVQRHLTSLYNKTGTQTRAGLTGLFTRY